MLINLEDRTNLIKNRFVQKALEVVTSDITEIYYNFGKSKAYLCTHKDSFSQYVYGFSLKTHMRKSLILESLKMAIKTISSMLKIKKSKVEEIGIVWHQDQGSQYTSYSYVEKVTRLGQISYSRKGTPTDNPGQESFFGRFKEEQGEGFIECKTFEDLRKSIKEKIDYYNNERLHTSIGFIPPAEFTKSLLKNRVTSSVE